MILESQPMVVSRELLDRETATMGRELVGAGLEPAYYRVNAYYEHSGIYGELIYWFGPVAKPLAIISILSSLWFSWSLRKRGYVFFGLLSVFASVGMLILFDNHERVLELFSAWLE